MRAAEFKMRASTSSHVARFFWKHHPSSNPANKNLAALVLEIPKDLVNCSELDTRSYEHFFLQ
jgi:hypothetical protein